MFNTRVDTELIFLAYFYITRFYIFTHYIKHINAGKKRLQNQDILLLEEASKRGYLNLTRSLLKSGVKCSRIVIRNCCMSGNADLIQYMYP